MAAPVAPVAAGCGAGAAPAAAALTAVSALFAAIRKVDQPALQRSLAADGIGPGHRSEHGQVPI
eukprot:gene4157-6036_t